MRTLNNSQRESGFTLLEILFVIIIMGIILAIAIPKLALSSENARKNADVATAHQVKDALDRYQAENGLYPKEGELKTSSGAVMCDELIPKYIGKLDKTTTQQSVPDAKKGFGTSELQADPVDKTRYSIPDPSTGETICPVMIYLTEDGLGAEVRAYDGSGKVLWTSAN